MLIRFDFGMVIVHSLPTLIYVLKDGIFSFESMIFLFLCIHLLYPVGIETHEIDEMRIKFGVDFSISC
jgi:hypothetical protein